MRVAPNILFTLCTWFQNKWFHSVYVTCRATTHVQHASLPLCSTFVLLSWLHGLVASLCMSNARSLLGFSSWGNSGFRFSATLYCSSKLFVCQTYPSRKRCRYSLGESMLVLGKKSRLCSQIQHDLVSYMHAHLTNDWLWVNSSLL